jgi:hypothetical protein
MVSGMTTHHPHRHVFTAIVRTLLGLGFLVTGTNYFVHFMPMPAMPVPAQQFLGALHDAGYVMPIVKTIEIAAGLALVCNRFVPLALTLLAPLLVSIVGFHLALAPAAIGLPIALLALEIMCAISYRAAFAPMLRARVEAALPVDHLRDREVAARPAHVAM